MDGVLLTRAFPFIQDPDLWFADGDTLVFLHDGRNTTKPPVFLIPLAALEAANCSVLLHTYLKRAPTVRRRPDSVPSQLALQDAELRRLSGFDASRRPCQMHELHMPAPPGYHEDQVAGYHIVIRNLFAWIFGKPVVGTHLGKSLINLHYRLRRYRPDGAGNVTDMLGYLLQQGYTDFRECTDHALAVLQWAEHFRVENAWLDAFGHCAGMAERLELSPEFAAVTKPTKARLNKARIEIAARLGNAQKTVSSFEDEALSSSNFGLTDEAREHWDQFRQFLSTFYAERFSQWPVEELGDKTMYNRALYQALYVDFRDLYNYLVDLNSTDSFQDYNPTGGLCVLQNIKAFDERHRYDSLTHPLLLVPVVTPLSPDQKPILRRRDSTKASIKKQQRMQMIRDFATATNRRMTPSPLTAEYIRFEHDTIMNDTDAEVNHIELRKVRWILVYSILQTLRFVLRRPKEIRMSKGVTYPLCCRLDGILPWQTLDTSSATMSRSNSTVSMAGLSSCMATPIEPTETPIKFESLQPDIIYSQPSNESSRTSRSSSISFAYTPPTSNRGSVTSSVSSHSSTNGGNNKVKLPSLNTDEFCSARTSIPSPPPSPNTQQVQSRSAIREARRRSLGPQTRLPSSLTMTLKRASTVIASGRFSTPSQCASATSNTPTASTAPITSSAPTISFASSLPAGSSLPNLRSFNSNEIARKPSTTITVTESKGKERNVLRRRATARARAISSVSKEQATGQTVTVVPTTSTTTPIAEKLSRRSSMYGLATLLGKKE